MGVIFLASEVNRHGGQLALIRMVNNVPLLDSPETTEYRLVEGLVEDPKLWNNFGLDVRLSSSSADNLPSLYTVADTQDIVPFLTLNPQLPLLLQLANVRLGDIVVVVGIHGGPGIIPIPTNSKVRLLCCLLWLPHHFFIPGTPTVCL